jgi:eukaryotic-like serine/threonine-protein kinase
MANVYAARGANGEACALKLLLPDARSRPDVRARFEQEGSTASRVAHPGVVRVFEQGTTEAGNAFMVMELLEGETLADRLTRDGTLPLADLLDVADQVLDVLAVAHASRVVHRDLKPGNLFIERDGRVKLLDFGVARMLDPTAQRVTRTGVMLGTVSYMSPEQALGKSSQADGRSDLFALGAMMFRILAGRRVHEADSDAEMLVALASKPAPKLASVAPNVPRHVCSIVDLALAFSPESRYPDAATMRADVRAARAGDEPPYATQMTASREQSTVVGGGKNDGPPSGENALWQNPTVPADGIEPLSSPPESDPQSLVGTLLADRYRVEALLGSGGMGSVYRAQHVHMRKSVAIKVLHREMTCLPEVVARFEREAVAAARIEHPNVAAAKDFGRLADGSFYLVLEYVEGRSLRKLLDAEGVLGAPRALHIAMQIAAALGAAHAAGIVHRDLKPENVMLVEHDGDPDSVKVLDFGIAKLSAEDTRDQPVLTRVGSVFGTPEYMSPEQAGGQPVDARCDLYTVGILLYEMLSGKTPFAGTGEMLAVITRQLTASPPPLPASGDPRLTDLVMQLLAKSPDDRIQSADEVCASLLGLSEALAEAPPGSAQGSVAFGGARSPNAPPGSVRATLGVFVQDVFGALPALSKTVRVAGKSVPVWALAVAAAASLCALVVLVAGVAIASGGGHESHAGGHTLTHVIEKVVDPGLSSLEKRAAQGDRDALDALEKRPASKRSADVWRAIGRGHAANGELSKSVDAYAQALKLDPDLASDSELVADLRHAADDASSSSAALTLASRSLGSTGPDLLYDVWTDDATSRRAAADEARALLEDERVRAKATPALAVLLKLRDAKSCREAKEILPEAAHKADARAVPVLKHLEPHRGCGFLGLGSCNACLRVADVKDAIASAETRPAPEL